MDDFDFAPFGVYIPNCGPIMLKVELDFFFEVLFPLGSADLHGEYGNAAKRLVFGVLDLVRNDDVGSASRFAMSIVEHTVDVDQNAVPLAYVIAEQVRQDAHDDGMNVVRHGPLHQFAAVEFPRGIVVFAICWSAQPAPVWTEITPLDGASSYQLTFRF